MLITSAADPRHVDIRRREIQYLAWMAFRVLCFVLAVVLVHGWLRFVAIAVALIIPWVAVVVANGGPKPPRGRPASAPAERAPGPGPAAIESEAHPVVDSDAENHTPRDSAGPGDEGSEGGGGPREQDPGPFDDRAPFAPPYTPPPRPTSTDVGFFGPRRPPRR